MDRPRDGQMDGWRDEGTDGWTEGSRERENETLVCMDMTWTSATCPTLRMAPTRISGTSPE